MCVLFFKFVAGDSKNVGFNHLFFVDAFGVWVVKSFIIGNIREGFSKWGVTNST